MPPKRRNNKTKGENAKATAKPKSPEENHDQSTNDESDAEAQETPKGAKNGPKAKKLDYESRPTLPLSEHSETASDEESSDEKENESPEKPSKKPTNVAAKKNDSTANKQPPIKKQTKTVSPREKDMPSLFDTEESGSEETDEPEAAPSNAKSNLENAVAAKKATKPTDKKVTITEQEADSDEEEEEQQTISPLKKVNRNMKKAEAPPKKTAKASPKKTAKASNAKKGAIANEEDKEEKKVAEKTANKEKEMNPKGATFKTRANAKKPPPSSNFAIESTTKHAPPDTSQADSSGPVFNSTATIAEKTKLVTCFLIGGVKKSSLQAVKNFLQKSNVNVVVNATKIRETLRKMFEDREIIPADGKEFTNISKTFKKGPVKVKTTDKPKKMTAKKTTRNNAKGMDKKKKMKANDGSDLEQYSDDEDVPPNKR